MNPSPNVERIFLSCASTEFAPERLRLANHLRALIAPRLKVTVQEDLQQGGHTLLERMAECIRDCDLIIHIAGDVCGARPTPEHVSALCKRLGEAFAQPLPDRSYTQWEYHLARKFDKRVLVYLASPQAPRRGRDGAPPPSQSDEDAKRQQAHVQHLRQSGEHRSWFASTAQLTQQILHDLSRSGEPPHKANNIAIKSLGTLFKGRDDFLEQIRASLGQAQHRGVLRAAAITANATAATVHGLGGIGKTRAAIEYAHRYADDYTALLLVRADSPEKLNDNLAELCGPMVLDLPEQQSSDAEARLAAALRWLRQHPGWFLIIDNVDTEPAAAAVESLLGLLEDAGQVLITSRVRNWSAAVSALQLDVLGLDDSTAFLLERTAPRRLKRPDDAAQARALAEALGQLALALEQAGAHIEKEHLSFEKYLAQWKSNRGKVMHWFDQRLMQYPVSVAVTWLTTFNELGVAARELLRTLAWLAPDPVPGVVFNDSATLAELEAYSLLTWNDEGGFSVHRLVQEVTRSRMGEDERRESLAEAVTQLSHAFKGDPTSPSCWPLMDSLATHGQAIAQAAAPSEPRAALALRLGEFFYATGRFSQAHDLNLCAWESYREVMGEEHPDTLTSMNNLASTLSAQGELPRARELQEQVLKVIRRVQGEEHPDTLTVMNNLAETLGSQGELPEARKLHEQVLEVSLRTLGEEHLDTLCSMHNLALTLRAEGELSGARKLHEQVLEVSDRVLGKEHPRTLATMGNLAVTLTAQGDLFSARKLHEQVLEARYRVLGKEHPGTLISMGMLAPTLWAQGELLGARKLQERLLEIIRRVLGQQHPDTLTSMSNLAVMLGRVIN